MMAKRTLYRATLVGVAFMGLVAGCSGADSGSGGTVPNAEPETTETVLGCSITPDPVQEEVTVTDEVCTRIEVVALYCGIPPESIDTASLDVEANWGLRNTFTFSGGRGSARLDVLFDDQGLPSGDRRLLCTGSKGRLERQFSDEDWAAFSAPAPGDGRDLSNLGGPFASTGNTDTTSGQGDSAWGVQCPTDDAPSATPTTEPASVTPPGPGLALYSNGLVSVAAPEGWSCAGTIAQNLSTSLRVFPPDQSDPDDTPISQDVMAVTISTNGYSSAAVPNNCDLFPGSSNTAGEPCSPSPPGETIISESEGVWLFEDQPGTKGLGRPAGGDYTAHGVITYNDTDGPLVVTVTCTLPDTRKDDCTTILRNYLDRAGPVQATDTSPMEAFQALRRSACTIEPQASEVPEPIAIDPQPDGTYIVLDADQNKLIFNPATGTVTALGGGEAQLPASYTYGCDPSVFLGTWE